mmetsp:Transcript_24609/g.68493  ORF Transcript_24609/g.68493 Transcript_24609/m.68493 type:complete len:418 (-) Transcript_24609:702-1955(-)
MAVLSGQLGKELWGDSLPGGRRGGGEVLREDGAAWVYLELCKALDDGQQHACVLLGRVPSACAAACHGHKAQAGNQCRPSQVDRSLRVHGAAVDGSGTSGGSCGGGIVAPLGPIVPCRGHGWCYGGSGSKAETDRDLHWVSGGGGEGGPHKTGLGGGLTELLHCSRGFRPLQHRLRVSGYWRELLHCLVLPQPGGEGDGGLRHGHCGRGAPGGLAADSLQRREETLPQLEQHDRAPWGIAGDSWEPCQCDLVLDVLWSLWLLFCRRTPQQCRQLSGELEVPCLKGGKKSCRTAAPQPRRILLRSRPYYDGGSGAERGATLEEAEKAEACGRVCCRTAVPHRHTRRRTGRTALLRGKAKMMKEDLLHAAGRLAQQLALGEAIEGGRCGGDGVLGHAADCPGCKARGGLNDRSHRAEAP